MAKLCDARTWVSFDGDWSKLYRASEVVSVGAVLSTDFFNSVGGVGHRRCHPIEDELQDIIRFSFAAHGL